MAEKVWEIKNPEEYLKPQKKRRAAREAVRINEKDPGRAYTLSLFFWGVGQNYNDQRGKGLFFQVSLIGLFVGGVLFIIFNEPFLRFLSSHEVSASQSFLTAEILFFCILIFWLSIAGDAYHTAAKERKTRFSGIQNHVYPCLCSLLLPGWGQFLNGQPVKGSIFSAVSVFGLFAFFSIPVTLIVWPSLEPSGDRLLVEDIFSIAVLYAPLIPVIWLLSAYDALKISLDDLKKESFWERIKAANNRRRTQGWVRGVYPHILSTLFLVLLLTALLLVISYTVPFTFYTNLLGSAGIRLHEQGMVILPEIIEHLISVIVKAGR